MLNHCNFAFLKSCPFCPTLFLADRAANFLEEKETWIIPFLSFLFFLSLSFLRSLFPLPLHFFFFYAHSAKPIYRQIRENVFSLVPVKLARLIKKEGKGGEKKWKRRRRRKKKTKKKRKGSCFSNRVFLLFFFSFLIPGYFAPSGSRGFSRGWKVVKPYKSGENGGRRRRKRKEKKSAFLKKKKNTKEIRSNYPACRSKCRRRTDNNRLSWPDTEQHSSVFPACRMILRRNGRVERE